MEGVVITAVLRGGPSDGHRDGILEPLPKAVYVAWCDGCRRDHVHPIGAGDVGPIDTPVYELDLAGSAGEPGWAVYRYVDVDDELDALAFLEQLPAST